MKKILYPQPINLSDFNKSLKKSKVKYGLPEKILYCKSCVISNQRPNSVIEFFNTIDKKKKNNKFR